VCRGGADTDVSLFALSVAHDIMFPGCKGFMLEWCENFFFGPLLPSYLIKSNHSNMLEML
jgi:hypothetical protein